MRKLCTGLIFLVFFLGVLSPAALALIQYPNMVQGESQLSQGSFSLPLFEEDVLLNTPRSAASFWFNVPQEVQFYRDARLKLVFSHAETLNAEVSTMTVLINGTPLKTRNLMEGDLSQRIEWDILIPGLMFQPGEVNELKVQTSHRTISGECADIDNPANWVVLHKDSYVEVHAQNNAEVVLNKYEMLFYGGFSAQQAQQPLGTEFVIDPNSAPSIYENLMDISSSVALNHRAISRINFNVTREQPINNQQNQIYLGEAAHFSRPVTDNEIEAGVGFLRFGYRPSDQAYTLIVSGQDSEGVNKASEVLANSRLMQLATNYYLKITQPPPDLAGDGLQVKENGIYTFEDLGYGELSMAGAFHQRGTVSVTQPSGHKSGPGSYIVVNFRHSTALQGDLSQLTVLVNGSPAGSVRLSTVNTEKGTLRVEIPEVQRNAPIWNIDFEVYNYIGKVDCSKEYYDVAWTVIEEDSEVYFAPSEEILVPLLDSFPYFYRTMGTSAIDASVIASAEDLPLAEKLLGNFAFRASQNTQSPFHWHFASEFTQAANKDNLFFLHNGNRNNLPPEILDQLPIKAVNGAITVIPDLPIIGDALADKGILQVIRSPWDYEKRIFVYTYFNPGNLETLNNLLKDRQGLSQIKDQVAILDTKGQVQTYMYSAALEEERPQSIGERFNEWLKKMGISLWLFIVIGCLILLCIGFIMKLSLNKKREWDSKKLLADKMGIHEVEDELIAEDDHPNPNNGDE